MYMPKVSYLPPWLCLEIIDELKIPARFFYDGQQQGVQMHLSCKEQEEF